jgi:hypothetical protein
LTVGSLCRASQNLGDVGQQIDREEMPFVRSEFGFVPSNLGNKPLAKYEVPWGKGNLQVYGYILVVVVF